MAATEEKTSSSSSSNIPPEIIEIILSKLPSNSLLRFKTVSKSWNTMISDPVFIQSHLQSSKNSPNNNLFLRFYKNTRRGLISLVKYEGGKFHHSKAVLESPNRSCDKVLCECNGVLLLSDSWVNCKKYALWNPSTRRETYLKLPHAFGRYEPLSHGMCYDPITDDFKIVVICTDSYGIYSCKNDSWTEKKGIGGSFYRCMIGSVIYVDGATCWVLLSDDISNKKRTRHILVYFDPRTDELKTLQKPKELIVRNDERFLKVASLRDNLCLYCDNIDAERRIRFWIKEKGVFENPNWEVFAIIKNVLHAPSWSFQPLCFVGNKVAIKLKEKRFVYYSPREKTIEEFEVRDFEGRDDQFWGTLVPYLNSLLFPAGVGVKEDP